MDAFSLLDSDISSFLTTLAVRVCYKSVKLSHRISAHITCTTVFIPPTLSSVQLELSGDLSFPPFKAAWMRHRFFEILSLLTHHDGDSRDATAANYQRLYSILFCALSV